MKSINLFISWYLATVAALAFAITLLVYSSLPHYVPTPLSPKYQSYKALPLDLTSSGLEISIGKGDARETMVANFFKNRRAPLASYAHNFIETSDKYGLDYRLLPAIAMQESNGGKILPNNSYNPFGYGIYGNKVMRFPSYSEAIETVGKGLKENYIEQGLTTPEEIMAKYTPPSLEKGGAWAIGVSAFMEQML